MHRSGHCRFQLSATRRWRRNSPGKNPTGPYVSGNLRKQDFCGVLPFGNGRKSACPRALLSLMLAHPVVGAEEAFPEHFRGAISHVEPEKCAWDATLTSRDFPGLASHLVRNCQKLLSESDFRIYSAPRSAGPDVHSKMYNSMSIDPRPTG